MTTNVTLEVGDPEGQRYEKLEATTHAKAAFAWAPRALLEELGVAVQKRVSLRHTDGRLIKRDVGQTHLRIGDVSGTGTVVFGEKRDPVLVGTTTIEELKGSKVEA